MAKFEKLDNNGTPTGEYKDFGIVETENLLKIRNCKWKMVTEPRKESRAEDAEPVKLRSNKNKNK
jgi:hypothetical protein